MFILKSTQSVVLSKENQSGFGVTTLFWKHPSSHKVCSPEPSRMNMPFWEFHRAVIRGHVACESSAKIPTNRNLEFMMNSCRYLWLSDHICTNPKHCLLQGVSTSINSIIYHWSILIHGIGTMEIGNHGGLSKVPTISKPQEQTWLQSLL